MNAISADSGSSSSTPSDDSGVSLVLDGAIAIVTLDRPSRLNAQTPLTWAALRRIGSSLPGTIRVVVVRGNGRAFSAGLDRRMFTDPPAGVPSLTDLASMDPQDASAVIAGYQDAFGWLSRPDIVSIAAVQGHAVGAGFQLALACDLRVVADDAVFTMAEVGLGLVPDLGGTRRLVELIGYSRALDLCITARPVAAEEALRLGLVTQLVPASQLSTATDELARAVVARPRDAVIETKALLAKASAQSTPVQETAEREAQYRLLRALAGFES